MPESISARVSGSSAAMCRYVKRICPSRSRAYSGAIGSFTFSTRSERSHTSSTEVICAPTRVVRLVGERAADTGARLDRDLVTGVDQLERARGRQRDAVLVGLDLLGDADPHGGASLDDCPSQESRLAIGNRSSSPTRVLASSMSSSSDWQLVQRHAHDVELLAGSGAALALLEARRDEQVDLLVGEAGRGEERRHLHPLAAVQAGLLAQLALRRLRAAIRPSSSMPAGSSSTLPPAATRS